MRLLARSIDVLVVFIACITRVFHFSPFSFTKDMLESTLSPAIRVGHLCPLYLFWTWSNMQATRRCQRVDIMCDLLIIHAVNMPLRCSLSHMHTQSPHVILPLRMVPKVTACLHALTVSAVMSGEI